MKKLLALILVASVSAIAGDSAPTCKITSLQESSSILPSGSTQLLSENQGRKCLWVYNKSAAISYITFETGGGATAGVAIPANSAWSPSTAPVNEIWARAASGATTTVLAIEGK